MTVDSLTAPCSLLLEVFDQDFLYDETAETILWEVSTDPAHERPYLIGPRNYAEQEIDPIRCTASIGTVEVGVIDVPTDEADQTTGWMTARVHDIKGRRCRLRRWINDDIGWVTIADGPADTPRLDQSYAAYRWAIKDTRETERKLRAFHAGGVTGIIPHGSIYGFGEYTDDTGDHILLDPLLDNPTTGIYEVSTVSAGILGVINLSTHYAGSVLNEPALIIDEEGMSAVQIVELTTDVWGPRNADVLWRVAGDTAWNVARPASPASYQQPFVGTTDATSDGEPVTSAVYVTLFVSGDIPTGFPADSGPTIEFIIRYRGEASERYPYYVEGPLGDVLVALYNGEFSTAPTTDITGVIYDPAELDSQDSNFISRIQYDAAAFDALVDNVILRQLAPVDDVRAWAEAKLYMPSGWIPTLDHELLLSPVTRNRPEEVDPALEITNIVSVSSPDWSLGERTVSSIRYTYHRYFVPPPEAGIEVGNDGIALREIDVTFRDPESENRHGAQPEEYDAVAFSAIGTPEGLNIPGQVETANMLAQTARFEVLDRYRNGVEAIPLIVRRSHIPNVRVGHWVPWQLTYLPDRTTGLRGSTMPQAQIMALRDDDCTWRTLILEGGDVSAGPPGFVTLLERTGDEPSTGLSSALMVTGDEPSVMDVVDLEGWWDAAHVNLSGSNITRFKDRSGNARHLDVINGTIVQVPGAINGEPAANFQAAGAYLENLTIPIKGAFTWFGVFKITSTATYQNLFDPTDNELPNCQIFWDQPSNRWQLDGVVGGTAPVSGVWVTLIMHGYNAGGHAKVLARQDGVQILAETNTTAVAPTATLFPGTSGVPEDVVFSMFHRLTGFFKFTSEIAAFGFYGASKAGSEAALESALQQFYATW